jgi:hypothetical protein
MATSLEIPLFQMTREALLNDSELPDRATCDMSSPRLPAFVGSE